MDTSEEVESPLARSRSPIKAKKAICGRFAGCAYWYRSVKACLGAKDHRDSEPNGTSKVLQT